MQPSQNTSLYTYVCFLRALGNLKHLYRKKTACQNHDSESLRNATRAHKEQRQHSKRQRKLAKTAQICFLIFELPLRNLDH